MIAELIIILLSIFLGIVFMIQSFSFPSILADPGGLKLFPIVSAGLLIISGIILLMINYKKKLVDVREIKEKINEFYTSIFFYHIKKEKNAEKLKILRRLFFIILFSFIYPWFIIRIGFLISTSVYLFSLFMVFGVKKLKGIFLAVLVSSIVYILFFKILAGYIPPGVWFDINF